MTAEDALLNLLESSSYADFEQRRDWLALEVVRENILAERDALRGPQVDPWATPGASRPAPPKALDPRIFSGDKTTRTAAHLIAGREALQEALAKDAVDARARAAAEAAWKRAAEAPMFTDAQRRFVRQAEFLMYMKALDGLILHYDRMNSFNLVEAIDRTIARLNDLRTAALGAREALGASSALIPDLPRKLFQRLVQGTFIRYINWRAALDLDR